VQMWSSVLLMSSLSLLFKRSVDVVGGVIVTDPDKAMQIVAEGGGTRELRAATKFIVMKPKPGTADLVSS